MGLPAHDFSNFLDRVVDRTSYLSRLDIHVDLTTFGFNPMHHNLNAASRSESPV